MADITQYDSWRPQSQKELETEWLYEHDKMEYFLNTDRFNDLEEFLDVCKKGRVIRLTMAQDRKVHRRTFMRTVKDVEGLVASYRSAEFRKGVPTNLYNAFKNKEPIPRPIIFNQKGQDYIIGGNTRLTVARIAGVTPDPQVLYCKI